MKTFPSDLAAFVARRGARVVPSATGRWDASEGSELVGAGTQRLLGPGDG